MTTRAYLLTGVILLLPAALVAQPRSIKVKRGDQIQYAVRAEIEVTELNGEQERTLRAETGGLAQLNVNRVGRRNIEWSYKTPEIKLLRVMTTIEPGSSSDTVVATGARKLSTDSRGNVTSTSTAKGQSESLTPLIEAMQRGIVRHWFQPAVFRNLKPGAVWSEQRTEPIVVSELGIDAKTSYKVVYTYDGIIDTLGTRLVRIRWSAPSMTIAGTRIVDGARRTIEGDGDHSGTAYYSTIDGMLSASSSNSDIDLRVPSPVAGGAAVTTMWRLHSESIRQAKAAS